MAKEQWKNRGENNLSIEDDRYYDNDMYSANLDQENGLNYPEKD